MSLPSLNLDAFQAVVKYGNFSKAAKAIFITQSALSQRVINLEDELGISVFARTPNGVRLTEAGEALLQYTTTKEKMEEEVLSKITGTTDGTLAGEIKIAGLSSLTRSLIFPSLSKIARDNPRLHLEIYSKEASEMATLIRSSEVDITLSYNQTTRQGWKSELIGEEKNVMCTSSKYKIVPDKYFDHDYLDTTTQNFFDIQKVIIKKYSRDYMDEIYQIIDAVERGWGKAVIPIHLIKDNKKVKILTKYKSLNFPIYISYPDLPFYVRIMEEVIFALKENAKNINF